jgi:hypothetical protein
VVETVRDFEKNQEGQLLTELCRSYGAETRVDNNPRLYSILPCGPLGADIRSCISSEMNPACTSGVRGKWTIGVEGKSLFHAHSTSHRLFSLLSFLESLSPGVPRCSRGQ